MHYQNDHYTHISAAHGGDGGIEGFTQSGVVHQCYCPEKEYSYEENYKHLRDKMTKDIGKLQKPDYIKRLREWGVPPIIEWHFVIPEQKDSRIVKHAETKRQEVLAAKGVNQSFTHIHDDFKVIIKCADDFILEISRIIRTNLTDMKLNLSIRHTDSPDWSKCDSNKVENIRRKIKAVMQTDSDERINTLVTTFVESYISGLDILNDLRLSIPDFYAELVELESVCRRDV